MDGGWGPPPFTTRLVTVTPDLTPAAFPGLTKVTMGRGAGPQGRVDRPGAPRDTSGLAPGPPGKMRSSRGDPDLAANTMRWA